MEAILILETKEILYGKAIGVPGLSCGEVVFNTGMTGYQEILTDPSYKNQIINFTCPHIGNVGVNKEDLESEKIWAAGVIIKELSSYTSNWKAEGTLQNLLYENKVVGIQGIDSRYVTKKIRDHGHLKVAIMAGDIDEDKALRALNGFSGLKGAYLINNVSVQEVTQLNNKESNYNIAVIDFGVKKSILNILIELGCNITLFPHNTSFDDVMAHNPNGVVMSNGPGDPEACVREILLTKKLIASGIPIFGVCLGFQLLALALGAKTKKMSFGHHGINHPVQDNRLKQVLITSQNHGFVVVEESLPNVVISTHYSLFDGSLQGFMHKYLPIFAFQGHPEAGPGPSDAKKLFQDFITSVEAYKKSSKTHM
jgi:carbamoyl-phosphate synthase small subunit